MALLPLPCKKEEIEGKTLAVPLGIVLIVFTLDMLSALLLPQPYQLAVMVLTAGLVAYGAIQAWRMPKAAGKTSTRLLLRPLRLGTLTILYMLVLVGLFFFTLALMTIVLLIAAGCVTLVLVAVFGMYALLAGRRGPQAGQNRTGGSQ